MEQWFFRQVIYQETRIPAAATLHLPCWFLLINFISRNGGWIVYTAALTGLSDFISSIIKPNIFRAQVLQMILPCWYHPGTRNFTGRWFSFTFLLCHGITLLMVAFFILRWRNIQANRCLCFAFGSFLVCKVQVYIVHFPLDVFL